MVEGDGDSRNSTQNLTALGKKVTEFNGLETFVKPAFCKHVTLVSDEVTANCPVTDQPDWYTVRVEYVPRDKCIESKTFKLFMHSFRNQGLFCEALASRILEEVCKATGATDVTVTVTQKPRGGVSIVSTSSTKDYSYVSVRNDL